MEHNNLENKHVSTQHEQSEQSLENIVPIENSEPEKVKFILKQEKRTKKEPKRECGICADVYNKSNRKEIVCLYCNYNACKTCYEQFFLHSQDCFCMNCKVIWNREFLDNNFTKIFLQNDYKHHRENVLIQKQKVLLQSTIPIAEMRRDASLRLAQIRERKNAIYELQNTLKHEYDQLENEGYRLRRNITSNTLDEKDKEKRVFVKKCPNEECRGFLSTRWKCGLCHIDVCSECLEIKKEGHTCLSENVETAKLIQKDCKNCPKCGTYIHKIHGCDQMYCLNCNTAFSWNTGIIETGRIHNPHYYEWLKRNGKQQRELLDIPCGGVPQAYSFRNRIEYNINYRETSQRDLLRRLYLPELYNQLRLITHTQDISLPEFQRNIEQIREKELDLRCDFLLKKIDEDKWKMILQQNEYKLEYITNLSQLYQMLSTVGSDILINIYNESGTRRLEADEIIEKCEEMCKVVEYFNKNSRDLAKRFNKKRCEQIERYSFEKVPT